MKYRKLGKYGLQISEISIGGWLTYGGTVGGLRTRSIIRKAIDLGINFIDLADIYSGGKAELMVGRAIRGMKRSDLVLSSKTFFWMSKNANDHGLSRKHIMESVEKSLRRLGTDYLDIYFCHRYDPDVQVEEVVRAMSDLVTQGKILHWGTSTWTAPQLDSAVAEARAANGYIPAVEQPRYNMFDRHIETEIIPTASRYGMGLVVWSPLAQGLLTGKYNDGVPSGSRGDRTDWLKDVMTPENIDKVRQLATLASDLGVTIGQLALAWILRLSEISCAIIGATNIDQVAENVKASEIELDEATVQRIDSILRIS